MSEIWKDIEGYEGLYQVSNYGRVRSLDRYVKQNHNTKQLKKGKIIKQQKGHKGYLILSLCKDKKRKTFKVHRLVAQAFIPNLENKPQVNHINGDKTDNRIENLEWATNGENGLHAYKNGLRPNVKSVICINTGEKYYSTREAGRKTNTDHSDISKCCQGKIKYAGRDNEGNRLEWQYAKGV